jgi:pimeloyl-ACP methyl ester carboxylesterase
VNDETACASYLLGCKSRGAFGLLREHAGAPCVLVGYGAGGSIAAVLADEHPELVARL